MSEQELRELTDILFEFLDKTKNKIEKLREYTKTLYAVYDEKVKEFGSQTARIKYDKDMSPYLRPRLGKLGITELEGKKLKRASYIILKITEGIEQDQDHRYSEHKNQTKSFQNH